MERFIHGPSRLHVLLSVAVVMFSSVNLASHISCSQSTNFEYAPLPSCNDTAHRPSCIDCSSMYGYAGFTFESVDNGHYKVTEVFPSTPADATGLMRGDEIYGLTIEKGLSLRGADVIKTIQSNPHGLVSLKVRRGLKHLYLQLHISCLRQYPNPQLFSYLRAQAHNESPNYPHIVGHLHHNYD